MHRLLPRRSEVWLEVSDLLDERFLILRVVADPAKTVAYIVYPPVIGLQDSSRAAESLAIHRRTSIVIKRFRRCIR
jgi:hypothetical protein